MIATRPRFGARRAGGADQAVTSPARLGLPEGRQPGAVPLTGDKERASERAGVIAKPMPVRLVSLDAFRGLTILGMLLVNNIALGGKTPAQFQHAEWSGRVHLADLVFPWFLFIVGVAVPYAAASARRRGLPQLQYDLKALYRAAALVFLGCLIDSSFAHRPVFGLGVLQLIGLAYFVAVLVGGLLSLPGRLILAGLLLVGHWALIRFMPIPGAGAGHFRPDLNVVDYINRTYLEPWHLRGLVSVVPTTAMVLLGTAVGDLLRRKRIAPAAKIVVLTVCGAGLVAAGLLWSHDLPMNKPLWTAPYILYTAGWACIGLAVMYLVVDTVPRPFGALLAFPLIVPGMNAIAAYVAPILTKALILYNISVAGPGGKPLNLEQAIQRWCYDLAGRVDGGWLYTLGYIAFWWLVLLLLYRKRWFLRV